MNLTLEQPNETIFTLLYLKFENLIYSHARLRKYTTINPYKFKFEYENFKIR